MKSSRLYRDGLFYILVMYIALVVLVVVVDGGKWIPSMENIWLLL